MRLWVASLLMAAGLGSDALAEKTFGLVIGIDDYTYIPKLHGAVNDALDIANTLRGLGADVTLLTDGEATRAAVLGSWQDILNRAKPGDRLVISYAGHGSNEPEQTAGSERDGRDENFLLAGFAPRGEAAGQRIRDDEIADLLAQSAGLDVIFVADACHSGTVTRNLQPALGYRYVEAETLEADPLPPPPPPARAEGKDSVVLFLAAVSETEKVPEVMIDGTPRGALSYAFSSGLRGAADFDGNGTVTKGELETHVRRTVRQVSDGVQLPQSEPAGQENRVIASVPKPDPKPTTRKPLKDLSFSDLPPISVSTGLAHLDGTVAGTPATLTLKGAAVFSTVGTPVTFATDRATLQAVADKQRMIAALTQMASNDLDISFSNGDRSYLLGDTLSIRIDRRQSPYLTLFNLGSDGTISLLYPLHAFGDPVDRIPSDRLDLPVRISAPFGADHVVAIETRFPATALHRELAHLSGSRDMARLWDLVKPTQGKVAVFPFFTTDMES
ncbi:MAG: DUF4384 domain-containing protein [Silicimonas sp.]|nr:DUF4384 domain-containing protein [Silicimonas sp.]